MKGSPLFSFSICSPTRLPLPSGSRRGYGRTEHRACGKCGSLDTYEVRNAKPMPYRCRDCQSYFSVRTGTVIERSKVPLRKWAIAIYLELTSLKSVSSMKLHRDIKVNQRTAWFMLHRIRQAWSDESGEPFIGPAEVDETYMGGIRKNMPKHVRAQAARERYRRARRRSWESGTVARDRYGRNT